MHDGAFVAGACVLRLLAEHALRLLGGLPAPLAGGAHVSLELAGEAWHQVCRGVRVYAEGCVPSALPVPLAALLGAHLLRLGLAPLFCVAADAAAALCLCAVRRSLVRAARRRKQVGPDDAASSTQSLSSGVSASSAHSAECALGGAGRMAVLACVCLPLGAQSLGCVVRLCCCAALALSVRGWPAASALFLALAAHVSAHPAMLLPSLVCVSSVASSRSLWRTLGQYLSVFFAGLLALAALSAALSHGETGAGTQWALLALADAQPGVGAQWYVLAQVFPAHACVYVFFLAALPALYAVLVPLRLWGERSAAACVPRAAVPCAAADACTGSIDSPAGDLSRRMSTYDSRSCALSEQSSLPLGHSECSNDQTKTAFSDASVAEDVLTHSGQQGPPSQSVVRRRAVAESSTEESQGRDNTEEGQGRAKAVHSKASTYDPQPTLHGTTFAAVVVLMLHGVLQPQPGAADAVLSAVCALVVLPATALWRPRARLHAPHTALSPLAAAACALAAAVWPVLWHNWAVLGRDTANVLYFATVVAVAAQVVLVVDAVRARTSGRTAVLNPGVAPSLLSQT